MILSILVVEQDGVEFAHVEEHTLVQRFPIFLITLKLSFELVVSKHVNSFLGLVTLDLLIGSIHSILFFCRIFHLTNEGQMLAAHLNQIANFSVRILNAGATISNVNKYTFGSFVVLAFNCSAHTQHKVGGLLFYLHSDQGTSLLKAVRSSLDMFFNSSVLSKEIRWFTVMALSFYIFLI
jgi:hypothetical protein